jgi:hypothetical protein
MKATIWIAATLTAGICAAQPVITDLQPRGAQKGRPFTLTVIGRDLGEGARIESTLPGSFTPLGPERGASGVAASGMAAPGMATPVTAASFMVELTGDPPVGVYPIRVITPSGISNVQLFAIGTLPEYTEDESRPGALPNSNDTIETAQPLPSAPLTLNGKLRGPERDVYRISAKAGERRVIEVEARRCGSAIDPAIEIEDAAGKVLARSEDAPLVGLDARVEITFPREGYYYVVVHDARFSTQTANFYRLKIGTYSYPQEVFPLGGRRGETSQVSLGSQKITVDLRNTAADVRQIFINLPDNPGMPVPFAIGDAPEMIAPVTTAVPAPVTINGRLAKAGAVDRYRIEVTPGEALTFRIQARELGTSKLMAVVSIFDAKGVKLAQAGDEPLAEDVYNVNSSRTAGDPEIGIHVPADTHELTVSVEDLARRGGAAYAYRLTVRKGVQDYRVALNTPFINVPAGGSVAVPVAVERHGFEGEVRLRVANAPKGLHVEGGISVALAPLTEASRTGAYRTRNSPGVLILTADAGAHLDGAPLIVEGVAELPDGSKIVRRAEGPGMMVGVTGATLQGSVDRQRSLTAPWLGLQLPTGITRPPAATLEVTMLERKRMEEGDQILFRWKWTPRDPNQPFPKSVSADMVGAADTRLIDSKVDSKDRTSGTFLMTTTKITRPGKYDFYISGRLMVDGQQQDIVSRPVAVEIMEVEARSAAKADSNR